MSIDELFDKILWLNGHEAHSDFIIIDPNARSEGPGIHDGTRCGVCFVLEHVEAWQEEWEAEASAAPQDGRT